jgi:hypothetical protein
VTVGCRRWGSGSGSATRRARAILGWDLRTGQLLRILKEAKSLPAQRLLVPLRGAIEHVLHLLNQRITLRCQLLDLPLRVEVSLVVCVDAVRRGDDEQVGEVTIRGVELLVDVAQLGERLTVVPFFPTDGVRICVITRPSGW